MDADREVIRMINGVKVKTIGRNVKRGNVDLAVDSGSTGLRGYLPRGKSARAFVSLECRDGDFYFCPTEDKNGDVNGMVICCCGDHALLALDEALEYARGALHSC